MNYLSNDKKQDNEVDNNPGFLPNRSTTVGTLVSESENIHHREFSGSLSSLNFPSRMSYFYIFIQMHVAKHPS